MDSPPFLLLCGNNTPAAGAAAAAGAATELLKEAAAAKEIKIKSLSSFLQEDVSSVIQQKVFFVSLDTKEAKEQQFAAAAAVLLQHLQTNGLLILAVEGAAAAEVLAAANRSCMYSGFLELRREEWPQNILKAAEKRNNVSIGVWKKPPWAVGASAPIGASAAAATGAAAGGETGLIDENSLIDPKETYTPLGKGRSDCASRPRACANCTCGRKELEEKADKEAFKKLLETGAVRSSCGNCYLGDAFRCAGCPYRGLPAFRPGEKVDLSAEGRAGAAAAVTAAAAAAAAPGDAAAAGITVDKTTNKVVLSSLDDDI